MFRKLWSRPVWIASAILAMTGLVIAPAAPAQAATCYNNGQPQHRFIACVDGSGSQIWAWGQYDLRYYTSPALTLQGYQPANGWGDVTWTGSPYATYIFVTSIKTVVQEVGPLKQLYGITSVRACLMAAENGSLVERCSGAQSI